MIDGCIDIDEEHDVRCSPDQHQEVSVDSYYDVTIQNNQRRPHRLHVSASILALLLLSCYLPLAAGNSNADNSQTTSSSTSPFRIVIDAGSTGSRLHIFEMVSSSSSSSSGGSSGSTTSATDAADTRIECLRRGSSKAWTPLSAFAPSSQEEQTNDNNHDEKENLNATHVAHHMLPLFDYASIIIPQQYHSTTPVRIAATAGMRLVSPDEQILVYDALYEGLMEQQTPNGEFSFINLKRDDIMTLDGEREAYFGAVAANYLRGVIDAELRVIVPSDEEEVEDEQEVAAARKHQHKQGVQNDDDDDDDDDINKKGICTNKFKMCEQDAEDIVFGPSQHYVSQQRHDVRAHGPLGALDMGGSSTQIVYRRNNNSNSNRKDADSSNLAFRRSSPSNDGNSNDDDIENLDIPSHLNDEEFFSTSYLSYGADQFRERLWDLWVVEATNQRKDGTTVVNKEDRTQTLPVIKNPCSFVGYEHEYRGFILRGTGNAIMCAEQINRLIPHHDNVIDLDELFDENREAANKHLKEQTQPESKRKLVGGVEHPPIQQGMKFYGMSLYFFTLDCLRELSDPDHPIHVSWPTPSIEELTHALDGFCSRKWQGDLEEVQHEAHEHTRAEVLPHRCVEAVYMVTLLRDGFGFHPSSRDITFTQWVDGNEVEWSLGMALSEYAIERRQQT